MLQYVLSDKRVHETMKFSLFFEKKRHRYDFDLAQNKISCSYN